MFPKTIGVLCGLLAALMWALEPVSVRYAVITTNAIQLAAGTAIVMALIGLAYAKYTGGSLRIKKHHFGAIGYIAIAGSVFGTIIYFLSLEKIPVVNAVLLIHLQPVFIILIGYVFLQEDHLNVYDYAGITFMIIAGIIVSTRTMDNLLALNFGSFAELFVLLATFLWATAGIVGRKYLLAVNTGTITFYRFGIAGILLLIFLLFTSGIAFNVFHVLTGIIGGVGYICYYESLRRLKAAQVGALELASPFFAAALGFVVFRETITLLQISGIFLLCLGVFLLSRKEH